MNSIKQRKENKVSINFDKRGENYTLNVPHKNKWLNIISYFKRRGFSIGENPYYKEYYNCLSCYHKSGKRKNIAIALELNPASISVDFGHVKNLWDTNATFWDEDDSRGTKLTYLEKKRVELEVRKFIKYLDKWKFKTLQNNDNLTDTEKIIECNRINSHIHGKNIQTLDDIGKYIAEKGHSMGSNGRDSNGKEIICGDIKYFYDGYGTKRMMRGIAYHNVGNMWWIMINEKRRNVASFELFDYSDDLPKRKKLSEQKSIQRWKIEINKAEKARDYKKAKALWDKIDNYTLYNVWSLKNNSWFAPYSSGYVSDKEKAGVYTKKEIDDSQYYYNNGETTKAVLADV